MKKNTGKIVVLWFLITTLIAWVYWAFQYGYTYKDKQSISIHEQSYKKLDTNASLAYMQIDESYISY